MIKGSEYYTSGARALLKKTIRWRKADDPPKAKPGMWSREVVAITDLGYVYFLCYSGTEKEGAWQRPASFNKSEKVEWWIDKPF